MQKYNIIIHTTTACNFNCSYCNVVKDWKILPLQWYEALSIFLENNKSSIWSVKFFGGEPLIVWENIVSFIQKLNIHHSWEYEIVTNTSLLTHEIGKWLDTYFSRIFFSIDQENNFCYEKVMSIAQSCNLIDRLFMNLVISPGKEWMAYEQFLKLIEMGIKWFNILPVYFTASWSKQDLSNLAMVMKKILDFSYAHDIILYGFMKNDGYNTSLINESLFIDIDEKVYYSDIVSTYLWKKLSRPLFLWKGKEILLTDIQEKQLNIFRDVLKDFEKVIYQKVDGQKELHALMDYFSVYLNHK